MGKRARRIAANSCYAGAVGRSASAAPFTARFRQFLFRVTKMPQNVQLKKIHPIDSPRFPALFVRHVSSFKQVS
jgi:hypothetical protein